MQTSDGQVKLVMCATFQVNGAEIQPAQHRMNVIIDLYHESRKVSAIKYARAEWNLDLLTAKLLCDAIYELREACAGRN